MCALFTPGLNMRKFVLAFVGLVVSPLTLASTLSEINFFQLPGERFEVRMSFDTPPPTPKGYTIEKPARIVLDFPDVVSGLKELVLVIGGPYGFSSKVYDTVNSKISLSSLTFSHQMVRLMCVEQIYRAFTILKGEPYHHD